MSDDIKDLPESQEPNFRRQNSVEAGKLPKVSDRQLLIIGKLVEHGIVYMGTSHGSRNSYMMGGFLTFPGAKRVSAENLFDFPVTYKDMSDLYMKGLLTRLDKSKLSDRIMEERGQPRLTEEEKRKAGKSPLSWYENPERPSNLAVELVRELKERLENLRAAKEAQKDNPRFLVALRGDDILENGRSKKYPKLPGQLYVIQEDTGKSFRIMPYHGETKHHYDSMTRGTHGNITILKENVFATDVTLEQYQAMISARNEYMESRKGVEKQSADEIQALIAPIKEREARRIEQLEAMLEDGLRDALGTVNNAPTPG